jgi:phospholipase/lecithinase/hemolysin
MIVFGDSLSDNGNLAALPTYSFLNNPPYQHGFTNGINAVEQLGKHLGLPLTPSLYLTGTISGNNFAVAGARAAGSNVINLPAQVSAFLLSQAGVAPVNNLYVLFIGGNDLRDIRDQPDETKAAALMTNAINGINTQLRRLIKAGAVHILVVGTANVGTIPETVALAKTKANPTGFITRANKKSVVFNQKLAQIIAATEKQTGIDIVRFDLMQFFNQVRINGKALSFSYVSRPCFSSSSFTYYAQCNSRIINDFVFFDEIHPSHAVHNRVGRALFAIVPAI